MTGRVMIVGTSGEMCASTYAVDEYCAAKQFNAAADAGAGSQLNDRNAFGAELQAARKISSLLLGLGIPAHLKGFRFLEEAVLIAMKEPLLCGCMMHELYSRIADRYHTTAGCVERSIRNAIQIAWLRRRPEDAVQLLGRCVSPDYERPTNSELIALMTEHVRLYM